MSVTFNFSNTLNHGSDIHRFQTHHLSMVLSYPEHVDHGLKLHAQTQSICLPFTVQQKDFTAAHHVEKEMETFMSSLLQGFILINVNTKSC